MSDSDNGFKWYDELRSNNFPRDEAPPTSSTKSTTDFDIELRKAKTHHQTENWKIERKLKEKLAMWVVAMVTIYLAAVSYILYKQQPLSDEVLIALLTTTTINVLGLPYLIIKSLFGSDKEQEKLQN